MARIARVVAAGVPHHVVQRGNRRQPVFFSSADQKAYLRLMATWCQQERVEVWAYCLMSNHVHLVAVPENEQGLARAIGEAHRRYTVRVNQRENWRGYLWQGRFSSYPLDEQYLLAAVRYAELNPVRARLVERPWLYSWSSAAAHVRKRDDVLVKVKPMLGRVSDWREYLSAEQESADTEILRRHMRSGRPLGSPEFVETLEAKSGRVLVPGKRGPKPRSMSIK
ncbi:transposase [candidate division WOR-3 bacterium]|uniref:Transposase n=1 Tax=candidate division WOR-3 bacterium TaxID=2052148 RepID=A0A938BP94_UNCW3|nr:transposase [candidate division WOR-3 bacterium]